jgi:2-polyprenyl-6-hydroxyphenyl methylase / 3-demethylubiquinone-9 3-methyltransferase
VNLLEKLLDNEIDPAFKNRARIVLQEILSITKQTPSSVLDLGCGRGFYANAISKLGNNKIQVTALDNNYKYLEVAKKSSQNTKIKFIEGDAENTGLSSNKFDVIICSELLEHVDNDNLVLNEVYRITKPGGVLLISVPNANYPWLWDPVNWTIERLFNFHISEHIWWMAGIWAGHKRLYSEENLMKKLKSSGFRVEMTWRSTRWSVPMAHFLLYGIGKNLVERGWFSEFNRFNYNKGSSRLVRIVEVIFDCFDKLNQVWPPAFNTSYTNIIVKCRKI